MKLNELLRESQFSGLTDLQAATLINQQKTVKLSDAESFYTWRGLSFKFPELIPVLKGQLLKNIETSKAAEDWNTVGFLEDLMRGLDLGILFNSDLVQAGIDKLVQLNIISSNTANQIKALGVKTTSLADIHKLGTVGDSAVATARQQNATIAWFEGKHPQIIEQLYDGTITTKQQVINLLNS